MRDCGLTADRRVRDAHRCTPRACCRYTTQSQIKQGKAAIGAAYFFKKLRF